MATLHSMIFVFFTPFKGDLERRLVDDLCNYEEADLFFFPGRGAVSGGGGQLLRLVLRRGGFGGGGGGCFTLLRLLVLLRLLGLRVCA
ncbi:hypothetical protein EYF80_001240 [Liparis tanakae]|uniref:Uncharacterized protein n=1 Tax=Liparis tanakae TaxID=230148 RepID=A0A4Z2JFR5_9TELE|nr:hypothetical protein EYF80_001240 [Liparis tanakae]